MNHKVPAWTGSVQRLPDILGLLASEHDLENAGIECGTIAGGLLIGFEHLEVAQECPKERLTKNVPGRVSLVSAGTSKPTLAPTAGLHCGAHLTAFPSSAPTLAGIFARLSL